MLQALRRRTASPLSYVFSTGPFVQCSPIGEHHQFVIPSILVFSIVYDWLPACFPKGEGIGNATNRTTRSHPERKAGGASGKQARSPHRWSRGSNSPDREG